MAQPDYIEFAGDIGQARKEAKAIGSLAAQLNRTLARLQDAERRYAEVVRAAYGIDIDIERKTT